MCIKVFQIVLYHFSRRKLGGELLSISEQVCEIIGYQLFEILCSEMGGLNWTIPIHPPAHMRDQKIKEDFNKIMYAKKYEATMKTYRAVAIQYGVSIRKVQEVVSNNMQEVQ